MKDAYRNLNNPLAAGTVQRHLTTLRKPDFLKHSELTDQILGCFYEAYNELGYGFLESVYVNALLQLLVSQGIKTEREVPLKVWFRGKIVGDFKADLVIESKVIVEVKAMRELAPEHEAQLLNYLRATEIEVGLLLNFGPKPTFKRLAFDNARKSSRKNANAGK